jgi:hypothetical protein
LGDSCRRYDRVIVLVRDNATDHHIQGDFDGFDGVCKILGRHSRCDSAHGERDDDNVQTARKQRAPFHCAALSYRW